MSRVAKSPIYLYNVYSTATSSVNLSQVHKVRKRIFRANHLQCLTFETR